MELVIIFDHYKKLAALPDRMLPQLSMRKGLGTPRLKSNAGVKHGSSSVPTRSRCCSAASRLSGGRGCCCLNRIQTIFFFRGMTTFFRGTGMWSRCGLKNKIIIRACRLRIWIRRDSILTPVPTTCIIVNCKPCERTNVLHRNKSACAVHTHTIPKIRTIKYCLFLQIKIDH